MQCNALTYVLTLLSIFTAMTNSYPVPFKRVRLPIRRLTAELEAREEPSGASTLVEPTGSIITIRLPQASNTPTPEPTSATHSASTSTSILTSATPTPESTPTATSTSSQQPSQTPTTDGGRRKLVVAHHMVGNTFPYAKQDWLDDIVLAQESGIDGFALNTGRDEWEPARIADA